MENKAFFPEFLRYMILSILGTLGVSCYILADTFFVSKGMGTNGLAAMNIALPVFNLLSGVGLMLGMGGATKFSIYKCQNQKKDIDRIYTNTIYVATVFSAFIVLLGVFGSEAIAKLLGADAEILDMTQVYLQCLFFFSPAFILNNILLCFIRNDNGPQLSMVAMLVGSFSNIILDYVFIFPLDMGMFGAILATGLSPIISILMMLPHWLRKKNSFHLIMEKPNFAVMKEEISLGVPSLISQLSTGIVMIIFNILILSLEGNTGVAAYGVLANIAIVVIGIHTGIAQGVQPLVSTAYGSDNHAKIKKLHTYSMGSMVFISLALYAVLFFFADPITSIFNSERDQHLQEMAVVGLQIYFTSIVSAGYNLIIAVFFTSTHQTKPAQILTILRGFVIIIPLSFLMAKVLGMLGIWLVFPITESLVAILGMILFRRYTRKVL